MSFLSLVILLVAAGMVVKKIKANPLGTVGIILAVLFLAQKYAKEEWGQMYFFESLGYLPFILIITIIFVAIWRFRKHRQSWNNSFPAPSTSTKRRVER